MIIKKINLQTGGLKGAHVTYLVPSTRSNRTVIVEHIEKNKHPIHLGLETPFKDLRYHLLDITGAIVEGMSKRDIDIALNECNVSGITLDSQENSFSITGSRRCFDTKSYQIATPPVVPGDEYEHYDTVMKIIEKILEETKAFMDGVVDVSDADIAKRWIEAGKSKEFNLEAFEALPEDEQRAFAINLVEHKFGGVAMMGGDISIQEAQDEVIDEKLEETQEQKPIVFEKEAEKIVIPR